MAWERRGRAIYYYTGKRVGPAVRKTYFGAGEVAALAARFEAEDRRRRAAEAAALAAEQTQLRPAKEAADALDSAVALLAEAAWLAAGYRRHEHGSLRRTRS